MPFFTQVHTLVLTRQWTSISFLSRGGRNWNYSEWVHATDTWDDLGPRAFAYYLDYLWLDRFISVAVTTMLLFSKYKLPMITFSSFYLSVCNSIQGCLQMVGRISWHSPQYNRLAQNMAWSDVILWSVSQARCCTASEVRSMGMSPRRCFGRRYRTVSQ